MKKDKRQMKQRIALLETMFKVDGEWSELESMVMSDHLYRTMGMDITKAISEDMDFDGVARFCTSYVEEKKNDVEWLLKKGICGLPLLNDEKWELARYHVALTHVLVFG